MSTSKNNKTDKTQKILSGIDLLEKWVVTIMDQGIDVLSKDEHRLVDISTRLVDYGLPSIARKLRVIPEQIKKGHNWREVILRELAEYYLFCQMAKEPNAMIDPDIQQYIGVVNRKSEVESLNHQISDRWLYLGTSRSMEDKIQIYRNWFIGVSTGKIALYIEYIVNRFIQARTFRFGKIYQGTVFYYPSKITQRVTSIPQLEESLSQDYPLPSFDVKKYKNKFCEQLVKVPWLRQDIAILSSCRLIENSDNWYIVDQNMEGILLEKDEKKIWKAMALSLDPQTIIIGEYDGYKLKMMSAFNNGKLISI